MKFSLTLLLVYLCLSSIMIECYERKKRRTQNKNKFDDPTLTTKTDELWKMLGDPNTFSITQVSSLYDEVQNIFLKVYTDKTTKKIPESLQSEWDTFLKAFTVAKAQFVEVRNEVQKEDTAQKEDKDTTDASVDNSLKSKLAKDDLLAVIKAYAATVVRADVIKNATIRAISASIPPKFCWKSADFGRIPTSCPAAFPDKSGALCYENCENVKTSVDKTYSSRKFKLWGGVCWEDCVAEGHTNNALTCIYKDKG